MLHEALSLFIGKKTEKSNLVLLGEKLRLPPGFRRAIVHHPGIFYVSNKLKTETVVLREGYKRHMLVESHPMMDVRYRYVHLMHKGKPAGAKGGEKKKPVAIGEDRGNEFEDLDEDDLDDDDEEFEEEEDDDEEISDNDGYDDVEVSNSSVENVNGSCSQNVKRG